MKWKGLILQCIFGILYTLFKLYVLRQARVYSVVIALARKFNAGFFTNFSLSPTNGLDRVEISHNR